MDHAATVRAVFGPEWADPEALAASDYLFTDPYTLHIFGDSIEFTEAMTRGALANYTSAFSGIRWEENSVLVEGDRAAGHFTMHATHSGPWQGVEATGRTVSAERMVFFRFEGDLIAEAWEVIDPNAIKAQITD